MSSGRGEAKTIRNEYEYDTYGNCTQLRDYGEVRSDPPALVRSLHSTYINDVNQWMIGFLARTELRTAAGAVQRRWERYYDDPAFDRGAFGSISKGDCTMRGQYADTGDADSWVAENRIHYDEYGNAVALFDGLAAVDAGAPDEQVGHYHSIEYDSYFHTWPVLERLHVGDGAAALECGAQYDYGLGVMIEKTNYNGHATTYGYNALGYFTRMIRPGDSEAYPTVEYAYRTGLTTETGAAGELDRDPAA